MSQMKCPKCGNVGANCLATRVRKHGGLLRILSCKKCVEKFNTLELPEEVFTASVRWENGRVLRDVGDMNEVIETAWKEVMNG